MGAGRSSGIDPAGLSATLANPKKLLLGQGSYTPGIESFLTADFAD
jgi:hypothetical protein